MNLKGIFFTFFVITLLFPDQLLSQEKENSVLFSINNAPIFTDEFSYVYRKNNSNNENAFTKADIEEYLQLFINFKLKVAEARSLGYDTTKSYIEELARYQEQLTKPYLTEKEVTDQLLEEAYERIKLEVDVSHILLLTGPDSSPSDTLEAFNKIHEVWKLAAEENADFGELAVEYSEEPMISRTKGHLGYFTALQMVYPFENAAYQTEVGDVSEPFRTQFGYHILKVHDKRVSKGKVNVSHIMLRFDQNMSTEDSSKLQSKIFDIYDQAISGYEWDLLCKENSQDLNTKDKGGRLTTFGVGEMIPEIAEAAFNINEIGDVSDPVMTQYGWHILKLNEIVSIPSFDDYKDQLSRRIQRDSRSSKSNEVLISRLKNENEFSENQEAKSTIFNLMDSTSFTGNWVPDSTNGLAEVLFSLRDSTYTVNDFVGYVNKHYRKAGSGHISVRTNRLYKSFTEDCLIEYEKAHLEEKYEDYRYLIKEYREGILLFEIMEKEVWAKSGIDSIGLAQYYIDNLDDYKVKESANLITFEVSNTTEAQALEDTLSLLKPDTTLTVDIVKQLTEDEFSGAKIRMTGEIEVGSEEWPEYIMPERGVFSSKEEDLYLITFVFDYLPEAVKELNEIKGIVISDYQDHLDKKWIETLRDRYEVKVNKGELKKLYKSLVQ